MIDRGQASAMKHGISLDSGSFTPADGNCAFSAALANINERSCFKEKFQLTPQYYRRIWITDMKNRTLGDPTWQIYPEKEWEEGWNELLESGIYERGVFGDLMLFGIACGLRKRLLIFNTSLSSPHDPIYVCDPSKFGIDVDSEIPVILAYNLYHYESLIPKSSGDINNSIDLVKEYLNGQYVFGNQDLPHLLDLTGTIPDKNNNSDEGSQRNNQTSSCGTTSSQNNGYNNNTIPGTSNGKVKIKDMTPEQKKEYERKKKSRLNNENGEKSLIQKAKNRLAMQAKRKVESAEEAAKRKEKDNESKKAKRKEETSRDAAERKENHKQTMKAKRKGETLEEAAKRKEKDNLSKKAKRKVESNQNAAERKENHRLTMKAKRKGETLEAAAKRKEKDKQSKKAKRKEETSQEAVKRKENHRQIMKDKRKGETLEEAAKRKDNNRQSMQAKKRDETDEEATKRKDKENAAKSKKRESIKMAPSSFYAARNAQKVLYCEQLVPELRDCKQDQTGRMNIECNDCGALKWKNETSTVCCNNGKVHLAPFPDPPPYLKHLWTSDTIEARLFREQSRSFNNALALSSIKVTERKFRDGFSPSVIFEGKVS